MEINTLITFSCKYNELVRVPHQARLINSKQSPGIVPRPY